MNLSRFSIDPALFAGSGADDSYRSVFFDKLLSGLFEQNENLYVKTDLEKDRTAILLFPALYWLTRGLGDQGRKRVLYLCAERSEAEAVHAEAVKLCSLLPGLGAPALVGGPDAAAAGGDLVIADAASLEPSILEPEFQPRSFGFVIADQTDMLAEMPGETIRTIQGRLLPSWERKTLVISARHTPKAKNFAWDFADNPKETKLGETMGFAGTMAAVSKDVAEADKIRFILGLLAKVEDRHLCVFCNLKSTAAELSARLAMNGVATDYIAGNLNPDRKRQIVAKAMGWTGKRPSPTEIAEAAAATAAATTADVAQHDLSAADGPPVETEAPHDAPIAAADSRFPADSFVLVLTDEGAKGVSKPSFGTVVNYDIPLEPEFYFERLNLLKRDEPGAEIYNLVCERYMYGIPAIERLVDTSLAVTPLEEVNSLPKDLSAGRSVDLPEPRRRERFDRGGRDDRGRGRDFGKRDEMSRRDDRTAPPRDSGRRDDRPRRDGQSRRDDPVRREDHPAMADRPRPEDRPRQDDRRPAREGPSRGGPEPKMVNPYAMSMEERMALYRKKYGQAAGSAGKPRQNPRFRGQGPAPRAPAPRAPAARENSPPAREASASAAAKAADQTSGPEAAPPQEEKARGFLGKIQDIFGARKSE